MILSLLLLSLTALLVSSQEVEYQRGQLVPSHLFHKVGESPGPGDATFLKAISRTTNEKQAIPMLGTRKTPELARRWGKRARGSLRDKKERLLLFRGQMNSNKNLRRM